jgi:hypothetical protein
MEKPTSTTNKLLVVLSITHNILAAIVISCIYLYSIDIDIPFIDFFALSVPMSFIIFKRCIYSDIHEHIRLGQEVPEYTEDAYLFKVLQRFLFNREFIAKSHLKEYKKGKVTDVQFFSQLDDQDLISDVFNEKAHYIAINCILAVILLTKYKMKKLIPLYLIWFYHTFSN